MEEVLPYEHGRLTPIDIVVASREGVICDGFGDVVIRAGEGRSVLIEMTEDLSGTTVVATIDAYRPRRAYTNLEVDKLCRWIQSAAREDGMPTPLPDPM